MTPSHAESASAPPVTPPRQPPHEHPKPTPEPKPTHHPKQTEQPAPKTPLRKSAQSTPDGATPASFRHTALPSPAGSVVEVAGSVPGTPDALAVTGSALPVDKGIAAGAGLLIAGSAAAFLGRRKGAEPATVEADQAPGDSD